MPTFAGMTSEGCRQHVWLEDQSCCSSLLEHSRGYPADAAAGWATVARPSTLTPSASSSEISASE